MADTLDITAGVGTTVATDDVGGVHYQEVKLIDGTKDSSTLIAVDVGVKANALRVAPANDITDATYIGDIKFGEALVAGTALVGKVGIDQVSANANEVVVKSGTVTTCSTVTSVTNLAQMGGAALNMGEGAIDTGTQRVSLATDDDGVAHLATIAGDTTAIQTAVEIIDDWDATHASAAPADGACVMGAGYSTALPADVGADADATRICTDRFGRVLAGLMPQNFQATVTSADAQAATAIKAKTASRKMYILSLTVSTDTALNVQFQDDTGPTVLIEQLYLAANGGAHLTWPPEAPLVVNTNEDFDMIASAAGNISVTITGYLAV